MINNKVIKLFRDNLYSLNGWLSIPNTFTAEAMSKMGWDSITIDMQHGQNDYSSSISMLQAISNTSDTVPFVRISWNEPGIIMKMLDLGVLGIIAPMINSKKECQDFVSYCNYPPKGQRSYGPMRAQLIYGQNYYQNANENIISLAMIETKEAVDNIDEILSVPNLTGVYIGPGDMSSSYGLKPQFDREDDPVFSNIKMIKLGYQFVTVSSDFRSMSTHAQSIVNEMKEDSKVTASSETY